MSASPSSDPESLPISPDPEEIADKDVDGAVQEPDDDEPAVPDLSDDESVLSDVDEAQFKDFDLSNVAIDERPQLAIDEENLKLIGRHKRQRVEDEEYTEKKKKPREGRREKKSRRRYREAEDDDIPSGTEGVAAGSKRVKKRRDAIPKRAAAVEQVNEEELDPATRRRRALDRMMDEALKKPAKRRIRKADGIDLSDAMDDEIEDVRRRMTDAARLDGIARKENKPAMHKLKMLPEVVSLLNRNQFISSLVDPDINLLEAVKFFLEPLDDGSLPAYNIQRDLMAALGRLPINKDALIASGIGKVILFYTKSKRPEVGIKRQAERLLAEWTRPILQRSDDYSKRVYEEVEFDPAKLAARQQTVSVQDTSAQARARELLPPRLANRARAEAGSTTYTVVPRASVISESKFARPLGSYGEDRFRRMKARQLAASKASKR